MDLRRVRSRHVGDVEFVAIGGQKIFVGSVSILPVSDRVRCERGSAGFPVRGAWIAPIRLPRPPFVAEPLSVGVTVLRDNRRYVAAVRGVLNPFGISPCFVSLVNDSFSTLFVELEAQNAAAIFLEGIVDILPQTLVVMPITPKLASVAVVIGLPALRPKPHAEMFARLLMEEARNR
jgi:hypothetical protein